jgi:hypothetical protein
MALIECPECHKEVSSKATACPHCGHPIAAAKGAKPRGGGEHGCLITVSLLIGFAALLAIFGGKEETSENREKVTNCTADWHKCSDNSDLVNNYNGVMHAQTSCHHEADKLAKYGTPKWPFLSSFSTFRTGDDYPKTGTIVLIEKDAQFSNAFGAMVHSRVECTYDLSHNKIVDISITPN